MNKPKLLPCPFCGKRYRGKEITYQGKAQRFECYHCGALGPFPSQKAYVVRKPQSFYDKYTIEAWNRRAEGKDDAR